MTNTEKSLPEKLIEAGKAFTQILEMENEVVRKQLDGIMKVGNENFSQMIKFVKEELPLSHNSPSEASAALLEEMKNGILATFQNNNINAVITTPPSVPATPATTPEKNDDTNDLDAALIDAVNESYKNTLNAQSQINILAQASTTQAFMQLYSMCTVTLAICIYERFNKQPGEKE